MYIKGDTTKYTGTINTLFFCSISWQDQSQSLLLLNPIASFQENEGLTLVLPRDTAEKQGIDCSGIFCCITLDVHSSLEAVGLTAAVAGTLTDHGISANVIAAFYHDHIFVQKERAADALQALEKLASRG